MVNINFFLLFYCLFEGIGLVIYKSDVEKIQFVGVINVLCVNGGGDCFELIFKGILDGMVESLNYGLFFYVFIDVLVKDVIGDNIIEVLEFVVDIGIIINFFMIGLCGYFFYGLFEKFVKEICGQMFKFFFSFELKKLFGIIGVIFVGIICFMKGVSGSLSGKKK